MLLAVVAVLVVIVGAVIGFSKIPESVSDITPGEDEIANGLTAVGGENEEAVPNPELETQPEPENAGFTVPDGYTDYQSSKLAVRLEDSENGPMYNLLWAGKIYEREVLAAEQLAVRRLFGRL